jgi:hypothetical protein
MLLFKKTVIITFLLSPVFLLYSGSHAEEQIHWRTTHNVPQKQVKFLNVPSNTPYLTSFPLERIQADPAIKRMSLRGAVSYGNEYMVEFNGNGAFTDSLLFSYYLFASVAEAEESTLEFIGRTSIAMYHAMDMDMNGVLGDNCFFDSNKLVCDFIRNNARVHIYASKIHSAESVVGFSKFIDEYLINTEKTSDISKIPVPVVESVKLLSFSDEIYTFEVNAYDPRSKKLLYWYWYNAPAGVSESNIIIYRHKSDMLRIWVINEDQFVTSKDIFN